MKRGSRMYIYIIWLVIATYFSQQFVTASDFKYYVRNGSNDSNSSLVCPKNCSEVKFELLPVSFNFDHIEVYLLVTIFILLAILAKLIWHLSKLEKFTSNFPESCMLIIIGIVFGYLILGISHLTDNADYIRDISFTPTLFFLVLLPPIVLEAGYFMNNRALFENALTIALLAFVNTFWNAFGLGFVLYGFSHVPIMDTYLVSSRLTIPSALLFGTFISAVDPVAVLVVFEEVHVNKLLHILVFGESLFNDAVTVVLFNVLLEFANVPLNPIGEHPVELNISEASGCNIDRDPVPFQWYDILFGFLKFFIVNIGGVLIGVVIGYLTCFITRFTDHIRVLEPMFIFAMAYFAYLAAELFELSGIISMIAVAITMKHYVEANISHKSHNVVKYGIKMFAVVSETIISLFIGLYTANLEILSHWDVGLTLITLVGITLFRVSGIFAISTFVNLYRVKKITFKDQFIMSYSGLRGAVAFGLALISYSEVESFDEHSQTCAGDEILARKHFVTTTLAVVFFTVFVQGSTVKYWMKLLHIKFDTDKETSLSTTVHETAIDHILSGIEEITGSIGHHRVRDWWERIDARYLRKVLERYPEGRDEQIIHRFIAKQHKDANLGLEDLCVRHGHIKKKKLTCQDTKDSVDIAPVSTDSVIHESRHQPPLPQDSMGEGYKSGHHRNSYLFDNIYHLMHLSRAKRDPHVRRRHKHLLFEKHDIHLHPHFFHKHKKTVSKKTQDKIIRNELPEHCIAEHISHFHPANDKLQKIKCLPGKSRSFKQRKKSIREFTELAMEEGVHSKFSSSFHDDSQLPSMGATPGNIVTNNRHNSFSIGATPDTPDDRLGQAGNKHDTIVDDDTDAQTFTTNYSRDEEPKTPLLTSAINSPSGFN
ncbi:Sodium/hydrogen exchanger 1-like [Oopsacas minuta]|uniref:Sodium/hydrogen exchanger n=1 Tax=Oopsacas minuta TaxID=111878 RepID=A0AAV7JV50_9METZ|nr:Sodium/hydrogen exchanger 1-like [Oopsacas minuta]